MLDRAKSLEILGLKPGATEPQIKEAYHDLVKVWHPDRFSHDPNLSRKAEEKMAVINGAYQALRAAPVWPSCGTPRHSDPLSPDRSNEPPKTGFWRSPWVSSIALLLGLVLFGLAISAYYEAFYRTRPGTSLHEIT